MTELECSSIDDATETMERYAAGDEAAFAELYGLVAPRLHNFLTRSISDHALAEDLLQQTLLQVHRARSSFLAGKDVLPWLFVIARRLVVDSFRRASRSTTATSEFARIFAHSGSERADDVVEAKELASRIAAQLARLPESQRVAFDLLKRQRLSLSEAAAALKITTGALKLRLIRAQTALRAVIEPTDDIP
jgi:RNA polymerase sigma-70 factor, ECF subfamily